MHTETNHTKQRFKAAILNTVTWEYVPLDSMGLRVDLHRKYTNGKHKSYQPFHLQSKRIINDDGNITSSVSELQFPNRTAKFGLFFQASLGISVMMRWDLYNIMKSFIISSMEAELSSL